MSLLTNCQNIIYCYICTKVAIVVCRIFEKYNIVNRLYIFCKICIVYCYNKNLINYYLFVVTLIVITIIFTIFISIAISILLYIVLSIFCFLILIVKVFALTIRKKICCYCNCKFCEKF